MIIRKADIKDIEEIVLLWSEFMDFHAKFDPFFTLSDNGPSHFGEYIALNIENQDWCIFVAEHHRKLIGLCIGMIQNYPPVYASPRYGFVQNIAVTKDHRRQGVAKCLFEKVSNWFNKKAVDRIELDIAIKNPYSKKFWAKMGFRDVMKRVSLSL